ncbi:hypothetical protein CLV24_101372 [Pontibacter ummariensis]|uniref:Outer membrane protein beta-barrel domain-containing protein n=1 Tax=Pontibacter ummariensis TaxID=1610492 RepID=A0A239BG89_9BACT|nr:hypothetical protein [Pontibacter ummariensis]PRY16526.1 hypothetical protein CLV24_101372 [Pontibacter ummariensis]SNS06749.1 hypothetical protein SAMN06296052_101372 [Pontibacter ummariensis]
MLYKKLYRLFFLLVLLLPFQLFAQGFSTENAVYLEVAGNSDTYSINYERILYQQGLLKAGLRAGIGTNLFILEDDTGVYPIVPVEAIALLGRERKHFEFGLGYTRRFTDDVDLLRNMYFGRIGFRYQKPEGGLLVRVALTPFISPESNTGRTPGTPLIPRFGFSVGYSF